MISLEFMMRMAERINSKASANDVDRDWCGGWIYSV